MAGECTRLVYPNGEPLGCRARLAVGCGLWAVGSIALKCDEVLKLRKIYIKMELQVIFFRAIERKGLLQMHGRYRRRWTNVVFSAERPHIHVHLEVIIPVGTQTFFLGASRGASCRKVLTAPYVMSTYKKPQFMMWCRQ